MYTTNSSKHIQNKLNGPLDESMKQLTMTCDAHIITAY